MKEKVLMAQCVSIVLVCFLSACVSTNEYVNPREIECYNLKGYLKKDDIWNNSCLIDDSVYLSGSEEYLITLSNKDLCTSNDISINRVIADNIIAKNNIHCDGYRAEAAMNWAKTINTGQICHMWRQGVGDNLKDEAIRTEVKARELDCPSVLVSIAAGHAAAAQSMQAEILEEQRQDQLRRDTLNSIKPSHIPYPRHTNCGVMGKNINCTHY